MFPKSIQIPREFFYDRCFCLKMVLDRIDESTIPSFIIPYKTYCYDLITFSELKSNREWQRICYQAIEKAKAKGETNLANWFANEMATYKREEANLLRLLE